MKLKQVFSVLLCFAMLVSISAYATQDTESEALTLEQSAQQVIEAAAAISGTESMQYALWQKGSIVMSGVTGNASRATGTAATDSTLYGIGSISKMYTTAAVLKLAEEGKLDLDTAVVTYLPGFTMADERYRDITVRMLLNHSSGLMGDSINNSVLFDDAEYRAADEFLQKLSTMRLQAAPGEYSVYSNDGFTLAELVIEAVSGQSFDEYVQSALLTPAELTSSFLPASLDESRIAGTYADAASTQALPTDYLSIVGAGGLYANASDVARFGALFMGGNNILTDASWASTQVREYARGMWPADSEQDALAYGLGWDTVHMFPFVQDGITALSKGGDTLRYHASLIVIPQYGLSIAVLSSGGASTYNQLAAARILIDVLAQQGITVTESIELPAAEPAALPDELKQYAGVYGSKSAVVTLSFTEEGKLSYTLAAVLGGGTEEFTYYSDGSFRDADNSYLMRFVTESNGHAYLYQLAGASIPGLTSLVGASYVLERLEENQISDQLAELWYSRGSEDFYLIVNEIYSSQIYLSSPFLPLTTIEEAPGYLYGINRIVDESSAEFYLQIPGAGSRSGSDISVYIEDGIEYMQYGPYLSISSTSVPAIYGGGGAYCTIGENGYARWYQVGELAGKTLNVTLPENSVFYVYDALGQVVASSNVYGDSSAVLPEDGWIVFAGELGARFYLNVEA